MKTKKVLITLLSIFAICMMTSFAESKEFKIVIMQDDKGVAEKYRPLQNYLHKKGLDIGFVSAPSYSAAARMFAAGAGDAMFSGSAVAGILMIKELAFPIARPVLKEGNSNYHAVVIVRKGTPKFKETAEYFNGKKVICTALASAGEFYYRSFPKTNNPGSRLEVAASHGAALDALSRGAADVAIVKNLIWEKNKANYPGLEKVKEDNGENPDMSLMASRKADPEVVSRLSEILINLKDDSTPEAQGVKTKLGILKYVKTSQTDFKHTFYLLKKAGVTKSFDFSFQ